MIAFLLSPTMQLRLTFLINPTKIPNTIDIKKRIKNSLTSFLAWNLFRSINKLYIPWSASNAIIIEENYKAALNYKIAEDRLYLDYKDLFSVMLHEIFHIVYNEQSLEVKTEIDKNFKENKLQTQKCLRLLIEYEDVKTNM